MKPPKFNFIPEHQLNKKGLETYQFVVTIAKTGTIIFNCSDVRMYDLGGKFIKLFADTEKKIIGWSIISGKTDLEEIENSRELKVSVNGNIVIGIRKLLKAMDIEIKDTKRVPVNKYVSSLYKDEIYYIELAPPVENK